MQLSYLLTALAGATVVVGTALPNLEDRARKEFECSGIDAEAQCCATDVLGLVDLDCAPPPRNPRTEKDFTRICARIGQRARCCVLPVLGQAIVCQEPN